MPKAIDVKYAKAGERILSPEAGEWVYGKTGAPSCEGATGGRFYCSTCRVVFENSTLAVAHLGERVAVDRGSMYEHTHPRAHHIVFYCFGHGAEEPQTSAM